MAVPLEPDTKASLNAFIRSNPYLDYVSIISTSDMTSTPSTPAYAHKASNFTTIVDLLQESINNKTPDIYFKAVPMAQSNYPPNLYASDVVEYKNGTLKLILTSKTFLASPTLTNIASSVKKLPHSKVGHGSKNLVSFNYIITFENITHIPPILQHVLKSHFNDCLLHLATSAQNDLPAIPPPSTVSQVTPIDPRICLTPLSASIDDICKDEDFVEYISLLHLNSELLIPNHVNEDLNSLTIVPLEGNVKVTAGLIHGVTDIHASFLLYLVDRPDIVSIVAKSSTTTWLLYKSESKSFVYRV